MVGRLYIRLGHRENIAFVTIYWDKWGVKDKKKGEKQQKARILIPSTSFRTGFELRIENCADLGGVLEELF